MKSCPEQRPNRYDALLTALILIFAAALAFWQFSARNGDGAVKAVVRCDGVEREVIPLSSLGGEGESREFSCGGVTLTVHFGADGVFVEESTCPTQDCVHTGVIRRAGQAIVCLPGRISIELVGTADYDLTTG